jgi:hypothetical protein
MKMNGVVETDEVYLTVGLKGRNNSQWIKRLSRKPRPRDFRDMDVEYALK